MSSSVRIAGTVLSLLLLISASSTTAQRTGGDTLELGTIGDALLDFGDVDCNGIGSMGNFVLHNPTKDPILIRLPRELADFEFVDGPIVTPLAAGAHQSYSVRFVPQSSGLVFVEFRPSTYEDLVLGMAGRGIPSTKAAFEVDVFECGEVDVGSAVTKAVVIENTGAADAILTLKEVSDAFSLVTTNPVTVPARGSAQVLVEFHPGIAGEFVASLYSEDGPNVWLIGIGTDALGRRPSSDTGEASKSSTSLSISIGPNPVFESSRIQFANATGELLPLRLQILDVRGRLVRAVDFEATPGQHSWVWDGLDQAGRSVSTGVYLVQLKGGGHAVNQKMTVFR